MTPALHALLTQALAPTKTGRPPAKIVREIFTMLAPWLSCGHCGCPPNHAGPRGPLGYHDQHCIEPADEETIALVKRFGLKLKYDAPDPHCAYPGCTQPVPHGYRLTMCRTHQPFPTRLR